MCTYIYITFIFPAMDFSYIHTSVHPGMHTYIHLCMHTYIHTRLEDVVRAEVSCTELEVAGSGFVGIRARGLEGARAQDCNSATRTTLKTSTKAPSIKATS